MLYCPRVLSGGIMMERGHSRIAVRTLPWTQGSLRVKLWARWGFIFGTVSHVPWIILLDHFSCDSTFFIYEYKELIILSLEQHGALQCTIYNKGMGSECSMFFELCILYIARILPACYFVKAWQQKRAYLLHSNEKGNDVTSNCVCYWSWGNRGQVPKEGRSIVHKLDGRRISSCFLSLKQKRPWICTLAFEKVKAKALIHTKLRNQCG